MKGAVSASVSFGSVDCDCDCLCLAENEQIQPRCGGGWDCGCYIATDQVPDDGDDAVGTDTRDRSPVLPAGLWRASRVKVGHETGEP